MIEANAFNQYQAFHDISEAYGNDPYLYSPFLDLKRMSSRTKGAYIEAIFQEYMEQKGCCVTSPSSSQHDRVVDGVKVEIKGSFLWGNTNQFRWQQIRNQAYDVIVFVAIYPDAIRFFQASKADVMEYVTRCDDQGHYPHNQHGGKKINSGTFFLDGKPEDFPFMVEMQ